MLDNGIYLGFDFGMQNIGVAVGQKITASATPVTILRAKEGVPDRRQIDELVANWQVSAIIVGLPYQLDGSEQPISIATRKFGSLLQERYQLQVYFMDERLTTKEAKRELAEQPQKHSLDRVDSYAAKLILESWLRLQ